MLPIINFFNLVSNKREILNKENFLFVILKLFLLLLCERFIWEAMTLATATAGEIVAAA